MHNLKLTAVFQKIRQSVLMLTIGGEWALALSPLAKRNLRWYWFDGLFSAANDNIYLTYLSVYILVLGATSAQIGLMSSLSSLSAALLLLPGAFIVEKFGRRKQSTILFGGVLARLMILLIALVPFVSKAQVIWLAITLAVLRDAFANLAFPGWMSLTGDIVPYEGRGRYFGSRNFIMAIAGMFTTLLMGGLITQVGSPIGHQLAMGCAFIFGIAGTFSFSKIIDPKQNSALLSSASMSIPKILVELGKNNTILALFATTALWNLSLNIAGPFFTVYLVQNLKASATMVGLTAVATSLASMLVQRKVGSLSDHLGPRRVQLFSMLLIPILPLLWTIVNEAWQVILINLLGGVLWGAFSLASFNYLLALFPDAMRARYSALYQIVVTLSLALGAALGSLVINSISFKSVFIISAVGRIIAGILFARFVSSNRQQGRSLTMA